MIALNCLSNLIPEAMDRCRQDAAIANNDKRDTPLNQGGYGEVAYSQAVALYLGIALSRLTDICNSFCRWESSKTQVRNLFGRQAIPMMWEFAENNVFAGAAGDYGVSLSNLLRALVQVPANANGYASRESAQIQSVSKNKVVSTDPPYYDNVGYADLSDFFYVWLRRSLKPAFQSFTPQ